MMTELGMPESDAVMPLASTAKMGTSEAKSEENELFNNALNIIGRLPFDP
jgi:hypothetical protein